MDPMIIQYNDTAELHGYGTHKAPVWVLEDPDDLGEAVDRILGSKQFGHTWPGVEQVASILNLTRR